MVKYWNFRKTFKIDQVKVTLFHDTSASIIYIRKKGETRRRTSNKVAVSFW